MRFLMHGFCLVACSLLAPYEYAHSATPECIVPGSPGGGGDLTCQLIKSALAEAKVFNEPMQVSYMPGGVGAVTYNTIVVQRPAEPDTLIAWSSGSLLNIAQGKFGRFDESAVRWVAAVGKSYGAIAVRSDSPYQNLDDLVKALKKQPRRVLFGSGGTAGGQDWVQAALIAKAAGIDIADLRYIALESGGESATALLGGYTEVSSTDVFESMPYVRRGQMRLLAVLAEQRLDGELKDIPTAKEQGYDIVCPVVRGYYLGPNVSDEDYARWKTLFDQQLASDQFARLRAERRLLPFALTGDELQAYVQQQVKHYKALIKDLRKE
ncbi:MULTISPECIES: tripartite tricarboxylate transporter substrate binding protein [Pseudomonas]|uniref:Tripartite tricarboxylate transporter substrate binding protein n=1 Tax=Pseudomonas putida TaxID=303 RepID=A0A7W2KYP5_PSEPU|nr:tripartite tricarboxylate transporter substrate binding protein [Pseudomonas putida]QNL88492.1 TctC family tripartite tricarboxylate transporter [Pseudomonas putida]